MSSCIFMLNKFSHGLQLPNRRCISKACGTEMELAVPGLQNGPFTSSPLQAVNWLGLECKYSCVQALGPCMQKHQRVRNSTGSLAGGTMSPWLASGSEVTTT